MIIADMCAADTGWQSYKMAAAINKFTEHTSRSFRLTNNYLDFPHDIDLQKNGTKFAEKYLPKADVIHVHGKWESAKGWGAINRNARWLLHIHGRYGKNDGIIRAGAEKLGGWIVSTINLLRGDDEARWVPAPVFLRYFRQLRRPRGKRIRIAHSPTQRHHKFTDELVLCVRRMTASGIDVELVLIEDKTHRECLSIRSTCHITFDQMSLCYGTSGLEGAAYNQAVVVGMAEKTRARVVSIVGHFPFTFATPGTLEAVLRKLVLDEGYRESEAQRANEYVRKWHDPEFVAHRMAKIYEGIT